MKNIIPFIWFQGNAEEAMNFYVDSFPNSKILHIERYAGNQGIPGEKELRGKVLTGMFEIDGSQLQCLDGGPEFASGGNISLMVEIETQDELDSVWGKLLDGGSPMQCGWVTDRFGITWQIIPSIMGKLMGDPNGTPAQKQALMQAMMPMVKLDGPALEAAYSSAK